MKHSCDKSLQTVTQAQTRRLQIRGEYYRGNPARRLKVRQETIRVSRSVTRETFMI